MKLGEVLNDIRKHGPARVLVDVDYAISPFRAKSERNVSSDIIFIRDDGWSLGAPRFLETAAYRMWAKEWVAYMRKGWDEAKPIVNWLEETE